jgi:hypothetical protein
MTAGITIKRPFGAIVAPCTTYIIIVSWWQHHQNKLPMAKMFTIIHVDMYMISMP